MKRDKLSIIYFGLLVLVLIFVSFFTPWISGEIITHEFDLDGKDLRQERIFSYESGYNILYGKFAFIYLVMTILLYVFRVKKLAIFANLLMIYSVVYFYFHGSGGIIINIGNNEFPVPGKFSYGFYLFLISSVLLLILIFLNYKRDMNILNEEKNLELKNELLINQKNTKLKIIGYSICLIISVTFWIFYFIFPDTLLYQFDIITTNISLFYLLMNLIFTLISTYLLLCVIIKSQKATTTPACIGW